MNLSGRYEYEDPDLIELKDEFISFGKVKLERPIDPDCLEEEEFSKQTAIIVEQMDRSLD